MCQVITSRWGSTPCRGSCQGNEEGLDPDDHLTVGWRWELMQERWKTDGTAVRPRIGTGTAFGTFGELLQGVHADNDLDFLVTFPIDRRSKVILQPDSSRELKVVPEFKQKSVQLAARLLEYFSLPCKGLLLIESDLPIGKGLPVLQQIFWQRRERSSHVMESTSRFPCFKRSWQRLSRPTE